MADAPAHPRHQPRRDRQAEAGAGHANPVGIQPLIRLEQPLALGGRHADPGIGDDEPRPLAPRVIRRVTPPCSVNFTALPSRLSNIWRIEAASAMTCRGAAGAMVQVSLSPLAAAIGSAIARHCSISAARSVRTGGAGWSSASTRLKSSTRLTTSRRWSPALRIAAIRAACTGSRLPSRLSNSA